MPEIDSKYEGCFRETYAETKKVLAGVLKDKIKILDIGAYEGNIEDYIETLVRDCQIYCLDIDKQALAKIAAKKYQKNQVKILNLNANQYLNECQEKFDLIIIISTLHEINDFNNQRVYLDDFLIKLKKILKPQGKILISDYYYSDKVTEQELEEFRHHLLRTIGHADRREKFVQPNILEKIIIKHNLKIAAFKEMPAVKEIDRWYYLFLLSN